MVRRKKVAWEPGCVFAVPLSDGTYALGQAIALMWPNVVYCALTDRRVQKLPDAPPTLAPDEVISREAFTREQLDFGVWHVLGTAPLVCEKKDFKNERYKRRGYVGAEMNDAALAEDFLEAFHALAPWDDWADPDFLDTFLVSPDRKPRKLKMKADA